eukprot:4984196-Amphidinium_carterae.1
MLNLLAFSLTSGGAISFGMRPLTRLVHSPDLIEWARLVEMPRVKEDNTVSLGEASAAASTAQGGLPNFAGPGFARPAYVEVDLEKCVRPCVTEAGQLMSRSRTNKGE